MSLSTNKDNLTYLALLPLDIISIVNYYKNIFEINDKLFDYIYYNLIDSCKGRIELAADFYKKLNDIFIHYNTNINIDCDIDLGYNMYDIYLNKNNTNNTISINLLLTIINYVFNSCGDDKFFTIENDRLIEIINEFNTKAKELASTIKIIPYYDKYEANICCGTTILNEDITIVNRIFDYICNGFAFKSDRGGYEGEINRNKQLNYILNKNGSNMKRIIVNESTLTDEDKQGYWIESKLINIGDNVTTSLVMDLLGYYIDVWEYDNRIATTLHFNHFAEEIGSKVRVSHYNSNCVDGLCEVIIIK